jgi:hypothetical protein
LPAVRVAERWVADPSQANRVATFAAAESVGFGTPAGCLAFAIWSDSEVAPDMLPGHPPKGSRMAPLVAKALLLAAITSNDGRPTTDPELMVRRLEEFLRIGAEVAEGAS